MTNHPGVKEYVDDLFDGVPDKKRYRKLKEQLELNLNDKITDDMLAGQDFVTAYDKAIQSIGDISDVLNRPAKKAPLPKLPDNPGSKDFSFLASLKGAWPILMLSVYLGFGFLFRIWHPTWLLFLLIPIFYTVCASTKNFTRFSLKKILDSSISLLVLFAYLFLGTVFHFWHPSWLMFLAIPLYYTTRGNFK